MNTNSNTVPLLQPRQIRQKPPVHSNSVGFVLPQSIVTPHTSRENLKKTIVEIPPSYRRRSCPVLGGKVVLGIKDTEDKRDELINRGAFGGTMFGLMNDTSGKNRELGNYAEDAPGTGWEAGVDEIGRSARWMERSRVVGQDDERVGGLKKNVSGKTCQVISCGAADSKEEDLVSAEERKKRSLTTQLVARRGASLGIISTNVEDNRDTREKFTSAKKFFEEKADVAQLDASSREAFFSPQTSPIKSSRRSSILKTKSVAVLSLKQQSSVSDVPTPTGTYLQYWTTPPAATVPVQAESVPLPGVVRDTVLLYQDVQKKADRACQSPPVQSTDQNQNQSYSSDGHYQSAIYNQSSGCSRSINNIHSASNYESAGKSTRQSSKLKQTSVSASTCLNQSAVHSKPMQLTKCHQTSNPTPTQPTAPVTVAKYIPPSAIRPVTQL